MTKLMEQAIERLRAVPEAEQDQFASFLLHELEEDARWAASTAANVDKLDLLAQKILLDDARGDCELLDVDKL